MGSEDEAINVDYKELVEGSKLYEDGQGRSQLITVPGTDQKLMQNEQELIDKMLGFFNV